MSTAIAVYNSEGCVGRCDARCHTAVAPHCDCICRGRLHGCGSSSEAIARNTEAAGGEEALVAWARDHELAVTGLRLVFADPQLPLGD